MICIDNTLLEKELIVGKDYELLHVIEVPYGSTMMEVYVVEADNGKKFIVDKNRFIKDAGLV